ncbi:hypothetical protein HHX47_DHR2001148 [Lentinula edodes]|nr:hypothetical protein HHX47_DHR2001148 [Lentinula edodes]
MLQTFRTPLYQRLASSTRRPPPSYNCGARYHSSHTQSQPIDPVDLSFIEQIPENGNNTEGALVILHGLFGSKRNWSSLSKAFSRDLGIPVYALV